jgi:hypothetical protein
MKKIFFYALSSILLLYACKTQDEMPQSKDAVKVYQITHMNMADTRSFIDSTGLYSEIIHQKSKNVDWKELDIHYKKTILKYQKNDFLGMYKDFALQYMFIKGRSKNEQLFIPKENTQEIKNAVDFYTQEMYTLSFQCPQITARLVELMEQFYKKEEIKKYVQNILKKNNNYSSHKQVVNKTNDSELKTKRDIALNKIANEIATKQNNAIEYLENYLNN